MIVLILFIVQRSSGRPNFCWTPEECTDAGRNLKQLKQPVTEFNSAAQHTRLIEQKKTVSDYHGKHLKRVWQNPCPKDQSIWKQKWKKKHGFKKISKLPTHVCFDLKIHVHALVLSLGKRNPRPEASMASTLVQPFPPKFGPTNWATTRSNPAVKLPNSPNHRWCRNP